MKIINYQVKLRKIFYTVRTNRGNVFRKSRPKKESIIKTRRKLQKYAREIDKKDSKSKGGVDDDIRY
ncbi:hypothetical protein [Staphylococcus pasteuri]|uniref:hypothetical protein n=1 Tax=Staphylococcus pasteuri TaxID=45972 RepID=UPI0030BC49AE